MHVRWRGLELPSVVTCDAATLTATYGKFIAEPFERGFGTTVGNGLRRVLLSSLEGSAITQIKVHNASMNLRRFPASWKTLPMSCSTLNRWWSRTTVARLECWK